jgi:putative hydrolase of the HAD superfamily
VAIEAVIFDYGGVLSTAPFAGLAEFEASMGYPKGSLARLFFGAPDPSDGGEGDGNGQAPVPDWHLLETGKLALAEFHDRLVERSAAYLGSPLDLAVYTRFLRTLGVGVHWMVIHRVRELRAAGYRTAILTNNIREWSAVWRATIPVDDFDVIVDSCEVGGRKPHPANLHHTSESLGGASGSAL